MERIIKLKKETQFGRIPFDLYALDKWDYEAPVESDGEQWKKLVKSYMALPRLDRRPYHEKAIKFKTQKNDGSQPNLVREKIERVLRPFQTDNERNLSELSDSSNPPWVRLCYDEALESKYIELSCCADVPNSTDFTPFLDDSALYDLNDDPDLLRLKLLERMPGFCDNDRSNYRANQGRGLKLDPHDLESKSDRMVAYFCFADREAIEQEFVKIMWLDAFGECLLISKITADELEPMTTMFGEGFSMEEAVLSYGLNNSDTNSSEDDYGDDHDDNDGDGGDEGEEPTKQKRRHESGISAAVESSRKRGRVNKTTPEYKAGVKAGYDAAIRDVVEVVNDREYDLGYLDGKRGRPHRKHGRAFD